MTSEPYRHLDSTPSCRRTSSIGRWDHRPAGFSPIWIRLLRDELGFDGVIFSDDLSMAGASIAGGIVERCTAACNAGRDLLLVCNSPDAVGELLANWQPRLDPLRAQRVQRLLPSTPALDWAGLQQDSASGRRG
ncbi:MAG: hypothetical protein IPK44_14675 [Candidatus Accumulibacter sp.]|nr:hypothetical protein [Accumulibacter sp.]